MPFVSIRLPRECVRYGTRKYFRVTASPRFLFASIPYCGETTRSPLTHSPVPPFFLTRYQHLHHTIATISGPLVILWVLLRIRTHRAPTETRKIFATPNLDPTLEHAHAFQPLVCRSLTCKQEALIRRSIVENSTTG